MQVIMTIFSSSHLLIKGSNSVLPDREIQEMFYLLVRILQNISIGANALNFSLVKTAWIHRNKDAPSKRMASYCANCSD